MLLMSVTLDVSKLSGWLNADASCPQLKGGHLMRGELWAAVQTGATRRSVCRGGLDCRFGV